MYKYKKTNSMQPNRATQKFSRDSTADNPPLTGWVNGREASDIEERFARAARQAGVGFSFQVYFDVLTSLPGDSKQVDFVLDLPKSQTVDVDGEFSHKTNNQQGLDQMRDSLLNNELMTMGYQVPHIRVPWTELLTQDIADRTVRNIVNGSYL